MRPAILNYLPSKAWILGISQPGAWFIPSQKRRMISIRLSHHLLLTRHREHFGIRRKSVWWTCKKKIRTKGTIRLNRNGLWRMRLQRPNTIWNKNQRVGHGSSFIRKNSKVGKSRLREFILILVPAFRWKQYALLLILPDRKKD